VGSGDGVRRHVTFVCQGETLAATLDDAAGTTGLLIVSGGNEIRVGAHRGMASLAAQIAATGHPVLRFDRRGIGDSTGFNHGFMASARDIAAALAALRSLQPQLRAVVGFGNCDAATALVLHATNCEALVLGNPWVVEPSGDLPPPAAVRGYYAARLRDPKAWLALLRRGIDLRRFVKGVRQAASPTPPSSLAASFVAALPGAPPHDIIVAATDATALAFMAAAPHVPVTKLASASHSFAGDVDRDALVALLLRRLQHI